MPNLKKFDIELISSLITKKLKYIGSEEQVRINDLEQAHKNLNAPTPIHAPMFDHEEIYKLNCCVTDQIYLYEKNLNITGQAMLNDLHLKLKAMVDGEPTPEPTHPQTVLDSYDMEHIIGAINVQFHKSKDEGSYSYKEILADLQNKLMKIKEELDCNEKTVLDSAPEAHPEPSLEPNTQLTKSQVKETILLIKSRISACLSNENNIFFREVERLEIIRIILMNVWTIMSGGETLEPEPYPEPLILSDPKLAEILELIFIRLEKLEADERPISKQIYNRMMTAEKRLDDLEKKLSLNSIDIFGRLNELESKPEPAQIDHANTFGSIFRRIDELEVTVDHHEKFALESSDKIARLEEHITCHQMYNSQNEQNINVINKRLVKHNSDFDCVNEHIAAFQHALIGLTSDREYYKRVLKVIDKMLSDVFNHCMINYPSFEKFPDDFDVKEEPTEKQPNELHDKLDYMTTQLQKLHSHIADLPALVTSEERGLISSELDAIINVVINYTNISSSECDKIYNYLEKNFKIN